MATFNSQLMAHGQYPHMAASVVPPPSAPPGTFISGTKVQVGNHRVVIDRYLSEGGFAHVYVVKLQKPIDGQEKAVLKRVAVPDKEHLANMRTEVETMKRLQGHKHIVTYIDSHASSLKTGGYEVFLLMEYCQGGGLIDFMNTRLQNRLTEPEIWKIFTDVAEGVARMHYLKPPLLHRDLKIENVLISTAGRNPVYKLCDFGSAAPPRPAATSAAEGRLIEDDIQKHTTLQYRSPEMIDVYRKHPIDEKSDIWALGCFLYKLCYYVTPFEEVGQMAILNASFKYPGYPKFSDSLKLLIATMLREQPSQRPNIYQVLQTACKADGREVSVRDIYSERTRSEKRKSEVLPNPSSSQSRAGASLAPPKQQESQAIPDIAPMRRGRPSAPTSQHTSAKPSPSPLRMIESTDPFAQLDGKNTSNGDELSSKFPTLDQFSLMTDKSPRFAFQSETVKSANPKEADLSKRVTNALADDAFNRPSSPDRSKPAAARKAEISRAATVPVNLSALEARSSSNPPASKPTIPAKPAMVSTGTMTSPTTRSPSLPRVSGKPIWRVPTTDRSSGTGLSPGTSKPAQTSMTANKSGSRLATLLRQDASQSQQGSDEDIKSASSARPSMEGSRPTMLDLDTGITRSRSLNMRARPVSVNMGAGATHIKDREIRKPEPMTMTTTKSNGSKAGEPVVIDSDITIASDIDFLKAKEEEERERSRHAKRGSSASRHSKRASLPSIALSGTKNILHGRFGDAFKVFEASNESRQEVDREHTTEGDILTPIAGSEATDLSEDRPGFDETEDLSPEMRRELEKLKLEAEEKRVANAAAEYKQRATTGMGRPPAPSGKAASIQNRVQSLLQDSGRPVQKTATGYGQYTESPKELQMQTSRPVEPLQPKNSGIPQRANTVAGVRQEPRSTSAPALQMQKSQRPAAPPKPRGLQTGRADTTPAHAATQQSSLNEPALGDEAEDWEKQFSQRYPSLSHLEMVETEINDTRSGARLTVKEI